MPFTLSEDTKERITRLLDSSRIALHYGWIPFIVYLGWSQSVPRPNLISLITPFPLN